jgi:hypothetical protein
MLQICDKTGFIASPSCPEMRPRIYKMGTEPKQFCGLQHHQNNRSPSNSKNYQREHY